MLGGTPANTELSEPVSDQAVSTSVNENRTPDAQRKALHHAKAALPNSPTKYVCTVEALITSATPKKSNRTSTVTHQQLDHGSRL